MFMIIKDSYLNIYPKNLFYSIESVTIVAHKNLLGREIKFQKYS